jgi:hypothetical protein
MVGQLMPLDSHEPKLHHSNVNLQSKWEPLSGNVMLRSVYIIPHMAVSPPQHEGINLKIQWSTIDIFWSFASTTYYEKAKNYILQCPIWYPWSYDKSIIKSEKAPFEYPRVQKHQTCYLNKVLCCGHRHLSCSSSSRSPSSAPVLGSRCFKARAVQTIQKMPYMKYNWLFKIFVNMSMPM